MKSNLKAWMLLSASATVLVTALATPALGNAALLEEARDIEKAEAERLRKRAAEAPKAEPPARSGTLKLYEWGVQRENWDGGAVTANDVPDFYYSASEVPLAEPPVKPEPPEPDPVYPDDEPCAEKPVIYFEASEDFTFDFEVKFTVGEVTWMYPKPSRRADIATAQWDGIAIFPDGVKRASKDLPGLHSAAKGHWSEFSREGGTSTLVVNGEAERFLFYEGTNSDLPEADVSQDAEGNIVIRNYSCCPIHDVRLRLKVNDEWRAWSVRSIPAASGDVPYEKRLGAGDLADLAVWRKEGVLAAETRAAGLTQAQGAVFERCWREAFLQGDKPVMTYRLDPVLLDENYILTAKLPRGMTLESKRVGYKWVGGIDLSRQSELDTLAATAAGDGRNSDAAAKLRKAGISGIGAVRRALLNKDQPLKKRIELAQILKSMGGQRR